MIKRKYALTAILSFSCSFAFATVLFSESEKNSNYDSSTEQISLIDQSVYGDYACNDHFSTSDEADTLALISQEATECMFSGCAGIF